MTRTELWESPCSMLMWSKRMTQLQICGRDAGDTRFGAGGRLVGVAEGTSGVAGGLIPPPQEASVSARKRPRKQDNIRFIFSFTPTVYYITHSFDSTLPPLQGGVFFIHRWRHEMSAHAILQGGG